MTLRFASCYLKAPPFVFTSGFRPRCLQIMQSGSFALKGRPFCGPPKCQHAFTSLNGIQSLLPGQRQPARKQWPPLHRYQVEHHKPSKWPCFSEGTKCLMKSNAHKDTSMGKVALPWQRRPDKITLGVCVSFYRDEQTVCNGWEHVSVRKYWPGWYFVHGCLRLTGT